MAKNKFLDLSGVSYFLNKCKALFAPISHSHNLDEITDYVVDTELSSTSTNPVENKAVQTAIQTLEDRKANKSELPSKTSDLTNDSGFITVTTVNTHNTATDSHGDIRLLVNELTTQVENFLDVDDTTKDQLSELIVLIEENADDIESITSGKVNVSDIIDNLTTNVTNKPLSAAQGVVMKSLVDAHIGDVDNPHQILEKIESNSDLVVTELGDEIVGDSPELDLVVESRISEIETEVSSLKSDFTKLENEVQTLKENEVTADDIEELGFWTEGEGKDYVDSEIMDLKAQGIQQKPLFANSIEECTDTTKMYVLPDGYIYAYMAHEVQGGETTPNFTNILDGATYTLNQRYSSSNALKAGTGYVAVDYIPVKSGDVLRFRAKNGAINAYNGENYSDLLTRTYSRVKLFNASDVACNPTTDKIPPALFKVTNEGDGISSLVVGYYNTTADDNSTNTLSSDASSVTKVRLNLYISPTEITDTDLEGAIVTINEEITYTTSTGGVEYTWTNTGRAFVPTDYEDRIIELEEEVEEQRSRISDLNYETKQLERRALKVEKGNDFTWGTFDKAYFVFVHDDSNSFLETAYNAFHSQGVPLGAATIASQLNETCSTLTVKEILSKIAADGGEVLCHYSGNLLNASSDDLWYEKVVSSKRTLEQNGFDVRGLILADSSDVNSAKGEKFCRKYYDYADKVGTSEQYKIKRTLMLNYSSLEEFKTVIDSCANKVGIHAFGFHGNRSDEAWITENSLVEMIQYIKSKANCEISTYSDVFDTIGTTALLKRIEALESK